MISPGKEYSFKAQHMQRARDIAFQWAHSHGAQYVTAEIIELAEDIAHGMNMAFNEGSAETQRQLLGEPDKV